MTYTPTRLVAELANVSDRDELEALIYRAEQPEHTVICDLLNELVHDNKSHEATEINNGGVPAQLDYLADEASNLREVLRELAEVLGGAPGEES